MKEKIREKLTAYFCPLVLIIIDESALHAGHREGGAREGTHFKIEMVSDVFEEMPQISRHQAVYQVLDAELKSRVHALSLHLNPPQNHSDGHDKV